MFNMESKSKAEKAMAEIRIYKCLRGLKLRGRNKDGALDHRCHENKGFSKYAVLTDYYDPNKPEEDVPQALIKKLQDQQMQLYDEARFEELTARIKELEM